MFSVMTGHCTLLQVSSEKKAGVSQQLTADPRITLQLGRLGCGDTPAIHSSPTLGFQGQLVYQELSAASII